jgi:hypothetical protein
MQFRMQQILFISILSALQCRLKISHGQERKIIKMQSFLQQSALFLLAAVAAVLSSARINLR